MSRTYDCDLLCIGSGPAGQHAALQAATLGKRVAVVEDRGSFGGGCVHTGTIPTKTLRESIVQFSTRSALLDHGNRPDSRPTIQQLLARVAHVIHRETETVERMLLRHEVELISGCASFVSPQELEVTTTHGKLEISAARTLIAVGTRSAPPPGASLGPDLVVTSDEITHVRTLPKSMAVVGGGIIGTEYASMFAALGIKVTLIEKNDRPLDFLDHELVDELVHQMRNRGVTFRFGEAVARIDASEGPPRRAVIDLESGKRVVTDLVLFAGARIGATSSLNLGAIGLAADERGRIAVDQCFRTTLPNVFAAGDVIGYPNLAATSAEQGRKAACYAFDAPAPPMASHFPLAIYSIPEISIVGATEQELTREKIPYETGVARYSDIARGQILGDDTGLFKMLFHREDKRLLGAHAIGTGATELIHIGQAVLGLGGGIEYFLETVFNYPTLAECYKVAAIDAANKLAR